MHIYIYIYTDIYSGFPPFRGRQVFARCRSTRCLPAPAGLGVDGSPPCLSTLPSNVRKSRHAPLHSPHQVCSLPLPLSGLRCPVPET